MFLIINKRIHPFPSSDFIDFLLKRGGLRTVHAGFHFQNSSLIVADNPSKVDFTAEIKPAGEPAAASGSWKSWENRREIRMVLQFPSPPSLSRGTH